MTPEQFLNQIRKQPPGPLYLFLGPENYRREMCRRALVERGLARAATFSWERSVAAIHAGYMKALGRPLPSPAEALS